MGFSPSFPPVPGRGGSESARGALMCAYVGRVGSLRRGRAATFPVLPIGIPDFYVCTREGRAPLASPDRIGGLSTRLLLVLAPRTGPGCEGGGVVGSFLCFRREKEVGIKQRILFIKLQKCKYISCQPKLLMRG